MCLWVAGRVESGSTRHQCDRYEGCRDRSIAETVLEVQGDEPEQDGERDLPGAPLPTRQPARRNEQHEAEWHDERLRDSVDLLGGERADQGGAFVRQHVVQHTEHSDSCDEPREHERASRPFAGAAACAQGAGKSRERCGQVDRLLSRSSMERLVRGNLADDQQR